MSMLCGSRRTPERTAVEPVRISGEHRIVKRLRARCLSASHSKSGMYRRVAETTREPSSSLFGFLWRATITRGLLRAASATRQCRPRDNKRQNGPDLTRGASTAPASLSPGIARGGGTDGFLELMPRRLYSGGPQGDARLPFSIVPARSQPAP